MNANDENQGHVCQERAFLALTRLRLEIAARLLERIVSASWHINSPYSCEVVGQAFQVLADSVGKTIEGEGDSHWRSIFRSWASLHRQRFAGGEGEKSAAKATGADIDRCDTIPG